jgi:hypothetical protein
VLCHRAYFIHSLFLRLALTTQVTPASRQLPLLFGTVRGVCAD